MRIVVGRYKHFQARLNVATHPHSDTRHCPGVIHHWKTHAIATWVENLHTAREIVPNTILPPRASSFLEECQNVPKHSTRLKSIFTGGQTRPTIGRRADVYRQSSKLSCDVNPKFLSTSDRIPSAASGGHRQRC